MAAAERYRRFAEREARGRSPLSQRLALGVAGDPGLLALLERLPPAKRQPNLLFAAVQYLASPQPTFEAFRRLRAGPRRRGRGHGGRPPDPDQRRWLA